MGVYLLTTEDLNQHAQDILSRLDDQKKNAVSVQEVAEELEKFLEYGVPVNQAKQTLLKKFGVNTAVPPDSLERTLLADLQPNKRNVKLVAQVVSINPRDIMVKGQPRQILSGLLLDESGTLPFTSWEKITVSEGDVIEISNAYTREWQGKVQLNFGNQVIIEKKEKDALPKETFQPKKVTISEITPLIGTIDLTAKILDMKEQEITVNEEKKTMYTGVLGDETGKIKFTAWNDFKLSSGSTVHINGGYIKSFRGMPQVNMDENATVKKLKKEIKDSDIPTRVVQLHEIDESSGLFDVCISGTIIEIQQGSGIILRCPECNQVLREDGCRVHGNVDGIPDLRVRCVVDDGSGSVKTIFNREESEKILGKTLDECKQLNPEQLQSLMYETFFARKVKLQGNSLQDNFGSTFLPTEVDFLSVDVEKEIEQVRSMLEELA